jgi:menaquinone-9 beta-reductase
MTAIRLANAGRSVTLLEKEPGPHHKVCGEFLSREAVDYLEAVGIAPRALGAEVIRLLRISAGGKLVEAPLPFPALSLSRNALDEALLERAASAGAVLRRGAAVTSLMQEAGAWHATLSNGETLRAEHVFLATGKHELRGFRRLPARQARTSAQQADLVGFKMHWQLAPAAVADLRECMELFLFSGGYGGISLVENGTANLCLVVRRQTLRRHGGWPQLLAAIQNQNRRIAKLLGVGRPLFPRPLAISPIPYGYLAHENRGPGHRQALEPAAPLWPVGDQAAVIPSFTGDGISIALHSGALAAQIFLAGGGVDDYLRELRAQLRKSMTLATWISKAAITRAGRATALPLLSLVPQAIGWVAERTRIPAAAMLVEPIPADNSHNVAGPSMRVSA